jgi:hypothetical protein
VKLEGQAVLPARWSALLPEEHPGDSGTALWRTLEMGQVRARVVDYSAGFRADHWCERGHVMLVLEGSLTLALADGRQFELERGEGFLLPDDESNPHAARSESGARVFIVD